MEREIKKKEKKLRKEKTEFARKSSEDEHVYAYGVIFRYINEGWENCRCCRN